jgi:hypothetical protein
MAAVVAALLAGCGRSASNTGGSSPAERSNKQAQREFDACTKQADEIARTQGADAGSAHVRQCTEHLARETQVQP